MSSWQLTLSLDARDEAPIFVRLAQAIRADVQAGRLPPGARLPGSRTLAGSLGVHRNTVLAGYAELAAQGWIETEPAGGTFVARQLPARGEGAPARPCAPREPGFDLEPVRAPWVMPTYAPGTLVLIRGQPDARLAPVAELSRAYRRALSRHGRSVLAYGDPRGHASLRSALAEMLRTTRGVPATEDNVMVTRGSQMALSLVARSLLRPGDVVAVEALGYYGSWSCLRDRGAELVPVPVDAQGLDVGALAALAARRRVRAVCLTPHHQFPTTTVMPTARRMQLLALAREHRMAVIEDDYDHEFHYDGRPVLPLAAHDEAGVVVYVGTLSKLLAPGLRVGFLVAPPALIERAAVHRQALDMQGDLALECALAEIFEDGTVARHARRMRRTYRERRDALVASLRRHVGSALSVEAPPGGMALWARAAPDVDVDRWAARASAHGVGFLGGSVYDFAGRALPFTRLGFTPFDAGELDEAARRMAAALPEARCVAPAARAARPARGARR